MAVKMSTNFQLLSKLMLDSRSQFKTLADMKAFAETSIAEGLITYCLEDKKYYSFDSSNTDDVTTGKWREFEGGNGIKLYADYSAFPTTVTKDAIVFAKEDYEDTAQSPSVTYEKGFYIANATDSTYTVIPVGSPKLTEELKFNNEIGGIEKDAVYAVGTTIEKVLQDMSQKYFAPTVTMVLDPATLLYKKGDSVASVDITAKTVLGSEKLTEITYTVGGALADTKNASTDSTLPDGGDFTYTYATPITTDTEIVVTATDGKTPVEAKSKIEFVNPFISQIGASGSQTEILKKKGDIKVTGITMTDDTYIFKYDSAYTLKQVLDINQFDVTSSFTETSETIGTETYTVLTSEKCTLDGFEFTFKFA